MAPIINPDFTAHGAALAPVLAAMRASPRPPAEPVVITTGWRAPRLSALRLRRRLIALTGASEDRVALVSYPDLGRVDRAAERVARVVRERGWDERPVSVVGISMGGLVARALAAGVLGAPKLAIGRVFTLATPHAGARLARWIRPDAAARVMRPGSNELAVLDEAFKTDPTPLRTYTLLRDWWVGGRGTAGPDGLTHWLDAVTPFQKTLAHFAIVHDVRFAADIARRLRGEEPLFVRPTPPPRD